MTDVKRLTLPQPIDLTHERHSETVMAALGQLRPGVVMMSGDNPALPKMPERPGLLTILVPRHPDRGAAVAELAGTIAMTRRSLGAPPPTEGVWIADTLGELAERLGLDPLKLRATVARYNHAVRPGRFDNTRLDGCATEGLEPPKTNWAQTIETPPFVGYPLRPGITFTYLGVRVTEQAQVLMEDGKPAANLFASGEIMAGNILGRGYLAGFGMTIGTVFGRIAGEQAARHARN